MSDLIAVLDSRELCQDSVIVKPMRAAYDRCRRARNGRNR